MGKEYYFSRARLVSPGRTNTVTQLPGPALNPFWWQSRLYPDSGIGGEFCCMSKLKNSRWSE